MISGSYNGSTVGANHLKDNSRSADCVDNNGRMYMIGGSEKHSHHIYHDYSTDFSRVLIDYLIDRLEPTPQLLISHLQSGLLTTVLIGFHQLWQLHFGLVRHQCVSLIKQTTFMFLVDHTKSILV